MPCTADSGCQVTEAPVFERDILIGVVDESGGLPMKPPPRPIAAGLPLNITVTILAQGGTNCQRGFPSTCTQPGDGS